MNTSSIKTIVEIYDARTGSEREEFLATHELTDERVQLYRQMVSKLSVVPPSNKLSELMKKITKGRG